MKHPIVLTILFLAFIATARAQRSNDWLVKRFIEADSVILISHEATAGVVTIDENGKRKLLPKLIVNNKPNQKIIREKVIINGKLLDTLSKIISRPFQDTIIEEGACYMPHHAVLLFKKNKGSFIDICFGCMRYETSKDLRNIPTFDRRKWKELYDYFIQLGFKYKLTGQIDKSD